jgi:hypothetical protein
MVTAGSIVAVGNSLNLKTEISYENAQYQQRKSEPCRQVDQYLDQFRL